MPPPKRKRPDATLGTRGGEKMTTGEEKAQAELKELHEQLDVKQKKESYNVFPDMYWGGFYSREALADEPLITEFISKLEKTDMKTNKYDRYIGSLLNYLALNDSIDSLKDSSFRKSILRLAESGGDAKQKVYKYVRKYIEAKQEKISSNERLKMLKKIGPLFSRHWRENDAYREGLTKLVQGGIKIAPEALLQDAENFPENVQDSAFVDAVIKLNKVFLLDASTLYAFELYKIKDPFFVAALMQLHDGGFEINQHVVGILSLRGTYYDEYIKNCIKTGEITRPYATFLDVNADNYPPRIPIL